MPAGKIRRKPKLFRKIHSLCFGVDEYKGRGLSTLRGCINDVRAIHALLCQDQSGAHILIENATREDIFEKLCYILDQLKPGELFVIHGSGHGTLNHNEFYYLPQDTNNENILGTGIPIYPLVRALSSYSQDGCKVLLILDTCNAAGVTFDISTYKGELKGGISFLFSTTAREQAFEMEIDGQWRGVFSYYIEQGLKGYAIGYGSSSELLEKSTTSTGKRAKLGYLTLIDLFDYAYDNVTAKHERQCPLLVGTIESDTIIHEVK